MTEETLFELALNTPAGDRPALLDRECAGNPGLRARVEVLLAAHDQMEHSSIAAGETTAPEQGERPPLPELVTPTATTDTKIARSGDDSRAAEGAGSVLAGKYTLVEEIGEGGMGTVYLAEQTAAGQAGRRLKLIKTGMDIAAVLARFDAERQALALMDHPNIARVYDGGTTEAGPAVLRHGAGQGRADHRVLRPASGCRSGPGWSCSSPVCQAVQHAHQKGIIHRDLKPSNVLVTEVDGRPTPKVIDFGVAKATGSQAHRPEPRATPAAIVGTPTYMSPEQADPIVDGHRHPDRRLCPGRDPLRAAGRLAADRREAVQARRRSWRCCGWCGRSTRPGRAPR